MTQSQLNEIKSRHQAALPKSDGMRDWLIMEWTTADFKRGVGAIIWYDDGDQCAEVHGNLGLDIDGDAVAAFFAHSMRDVDTLLTEIENLKSILAEIKKTCPADPDTTAVFYEAWQKLERALEP